VRYAGAADFVERDDVDHRAVMSLRGREERGNGSVKATVHHPAQARAQPHSRRRRGRRRLAAGAGDETGTAAVAPDRDPDLTVGKR
jgi:hypothetical protein